MTLWGEEFSRVFAKILHANGLVFSAECYYSINDIEKPLQKWLGRENAQQICQVIKIGIQCSISNLKARTSQQNKLNYYKKASR
jgi:hypothetical protein